MRGLTLDGVKVCDSWLTQGSFRAAYCDFLLPVMPGNKAKMLAEFKRVGTHGKYSGLRLSGISDLTFLQEFPNLLYLEVVDQKKINVRPLSCLQNLRGLRLETPATGIDFGWFPDLEVFVGDWHADNCNLHLSRELRQLRVWHYKPRSADLSALSRMTRLEKLHLTQTNISTLAGTESLRDLRYFEIAYAPKLQWLDALATGESGIRELSLQNAKQIAGYIPIAAIPYLRRLKISSCAEMPDLKWTRGMQYLDSISFVETIVADGDLSPLLDLPLLEYVGTMDKKRYNYKMNAINELLAERRRL